MNNYSQQQPQHPGQQYTNNNQQQQQQQPGSINPAALLYQQQRQLSGYGGNGGYPSGGGGAVNPAQLMNNGGGGVNPAQLMGGSMNPAQLLQQQQMMMNGRGLNPSQMSSGSMSMGAPSNPSGGMSSATLTHFMNQMGISHQQFQAMPQPDQQAMGMKVMAIMQQQQQRQQQQRQQQQMQMQQQSEMRPDMLSQQRSGYNPQQTYQSPMQNDGPGPINNNNNGYYDPSSHHQQRPLSSASNGSSSGNHQMMPPPPPRPTTAMGGAQREMAMGGGGPPTRPGTSMSHHSQSPSNSIQRPPSRQFNNGSYSGGGMPTMNNNSGSMNSSNHNTNSMGNISISTPTPLPPNHINNSAPSPFASSPSPSSSSHQPSSSSSSFPVGGNPYPSGPSHPSSSSSSHSNNPNTPGGGEYPTSSSTPPPGSPYHTNKRKASGGRSNLGVGGDVDMSSPLIGGSSMPPQSQGGGGGITMGPPAGIPRSISSSIPNPPMSNEDRYMNMNGVGINGLYNDAPRNASQALVQQQQQQQQQQQRGRGSNSPRPRSASGSGNTGFIPPPPPLNSSSLSSSSTSGMPSSGMGLGMGGMGGGMGSTGIGMGPPPMNIGNGVAVNEAARMNASMVAGMNMMNNTSNMNSNNTNIPAPNPTPTPAPSSTASMMDHRQGGSLGASRNMGMSLNMGGMSNMGMGMGIGGMSSSGHNGPITMTIPLSRAPQTGLGLGMPSQTPSTKQELPSAAAPSPSKLGPIGLNGVGGGMTDPRRTGPLPQQPHPPQQAQQQTPQHFQPPPLPANVNLAREITNVTVLPLTQSLQAIPPLSPTEIKSVAGWIKADTEYLGVLKKSKERLGKEVRDMFSIGKIPWWEKGSLATNNGAGLRMRGGVERFDVRYPGMGRRERDGRRKVPKREGLKIPRRLSDDDANRPELLVPIRLEFPVDHHTMRDTFIWNLNDPVVTPENFAQSLLEDYSLPYAFFSVITKSIHDQLSDYKAHSARFDADGGELPPLDDGAMGVIRGSLDEEDVQWWGAFRKRMRSGKVGASSSKSSSRKRRKIVMDEDEDEEDVGMDQERKHHAAPIDVDTEAATSTESEQLMRDDMRILIKLDITVASMKLDDQFEWDIDNTMTSPEQFAEVYAQELGLGGEFKTAIVHCIREQVQTYQKSLFLVGHPSDGTAVQDDDLRQSLLPNLTSGARAIDQVQSFTPLLNYLSDGEIERNEKDREKDQNKRRKRNTRGRRGVALPDREPIRTYRTPAIGFPELDAATLALVAANSAPTSKRAAAAAASLTIANMVASENGGSYLPQSQQHLQQQPQAPAQAKEKKPKGLFVGPTLPKKIFLARADITTPTPSTAIDSVMDEDPSSSSVLRATPAETRSSKMLALRKLKEAEREAKEKEHAEGQHSNMINGIWHCSNCGIPESVAVGRRKGPLGDKSQCGECGKYWHRHRKPMETEYSTSAEFHVVRLEKAEIARTGGARRRTAALRGQSSSNTVPTTPADIPSSEPPTPAPLSRVDTVQSTPKSPVSTASSSSEPPVTQPPPRPSRTVNGTSSRPVSSAAGPPNTSSSPLTKRVAPAMATPVPGSPAAAAPTVPPQWLSRAMDGLRVSYPDDKFEVMLKKIDGRRYEWRLRCLDCPGKLYTPGPNETLVNYEVHLKNRGHRQKLQQRLDAASTAAAS